MASWARLYGTERWRKRSRWNLRLNPMCAQCEKEGRTQEANLSHHINEYRPGDSDLQFWFGPLESLCYACHLKVHGKPAMLPYRKDIGVDGFPLDPLHPLWVEDRRQQQQARKWRKDLVKRKEKP
jgi:5-methylcytosine-specific restriction protein A